MNILSDHNIANSLKLIQNADILLKLMKYQNLKKLYDFINEQKNQYLS